MHESHLTNFVRRRLEALEAIDKGLWPEEEFGGLASLQRGATILASALQGHPSKSWWRSKKPVPLWEISAPHRPQNSANATSLREPTVSLYWWTAQLQRPPRRPEVLHRGCFPPVPFLYKDFVATAYQVKCAKALGASAVLLMTQLRSLRAARTIRTRQRGRTRALCGDP